MNEQEQRIAIAEACGMREFKMGPSDRQWLKPKDGGGVTQVALPDYCNDLNAMHEAEKVLDAGQRNRYESALVSLVRHSRDIPDSAQIRETHSATYATAEQRAEAFLKTLNLWT